MGTVVKFRRNKNIKLNKINESCSPKSKVAIEAIIKHTKELIQNIDAYYEFLRNFSDFNAEKDLISDGLIDAVYNDDDSHEADDGLNIAKRGYTQYVKNLENLLNNCI